MDIGGHVSTKGGFPNAVANALAIGAEVFQTHPSAPQAWRSISMTDDAVEQFTADFAGSGIHRHYMHAIYLINLATPKDEHRAMSVKALIGYLEWANRLGASGVVFHPGSHLGAGFDSMLPSIRGALEEALHRTEGNPVPLLLENNAGSGACVGRSFEEVAQMMEIDGGDRLKMCLDTAHMFASGYDVRSTEAVKETFDKLDSIVGFDRVAAVHSNDSKIDLGGNADRHENIGDGKMGTDAFRWMLADPRMANVPWILEVPGVDHTGPDLDNINRLRACAGKTPVAPVIEAAIHG